MIFKNKTILLTVSFLALLGIFSFIKSYDIEITVDNPMKPMNVSSTTFYYEDAQFWGVPVLDDSTDAEELKDKDSFSISEDQYSFWGIPKELIKLASHK